MKEFIPPPPALVQNETARIRALFEQNVVPTYGRFEIVLSHGSGSYVYDVNGRRYLDLGGGIAVCALGHCHPEITETLAQQSQKFLHVSNLYYHEPQGRLAKALVDLIGPGKCFFSNSGAEANEGLFKLARRFGHDEGRFEIITMTNSFHGRTLAGIAATGQDKVKKGFGPSVAGFRHVPFNDLEAVRGALSPATVAVLFEGIQGEGGVTSATPEYLLGLRQLCNENKLLLLMDAVQCGHFRTGRFQSFQRILEQVADAGNFLPDAISMAKSLGGGFPIGAFWIRKPFADLLGAGSHGTTFGGNPLACAVALKVLEVIQRDRLMDNARHVGDQLIQGLQRLSAQYPRTITNVRGLGLMIGLEIAPDVRAFKGNEKAPSIQFVNRLQQAGVLTIPAGNNVIRILPALNLQPQEAAAGLRAIETVVHELAS